MKLITLTTDFGARDWFVGTMKGVILNKSPQAAIVDITHEIASADIRAGAFALMASYRFFPKDTVHVVVVDPGVGSARKAIVVRTADYYFVGPDNGVLSLALGKESIKSIHRLENEKFFTLPVSKTFHGRDIFAPVAAHLCNGVSPHKFGAAQNGLIRLRWPEVRRFADRVAGEVVNLDRFGNLITNITGKDLGNQDDARVTVGERKPLLIASHYQAVGNGMPVALVGSCGFLELSVNGGSAAEYLKAGIGSEVRIAHVPKR